MKKIENKTFDEERALYAIKDTTVKKCVFSGPKDGESAFKECKNIKLKNVIIDSTEFGWRCANLDVNDSKVTKSEYFFFQCKNINIKKIRYGWKIFISIYQGC